jgi:hypothetical protein
MMAREFRAIIVFNYALRLLSGMPAQFLMPLFVRRATDGGTLGPGNYCSFVIW